jgi:hypothetical protein
LLAPFAFLARQRLLMEIPRKSDARFRCPSHQRTLLLAFGVSTTTAVGICVGAGHIERARRVALVSCLLAATIIAMLGLGVAASGRWIAELFTHAENVVLAASGYFHATGLIYAFTAISMMLFSAYQGWGRATVPSDRPVHGGRRAGGRLGHPAMVGREARLVLCLVAASVVLAASTLAAIFALRPPSAAQKAVSG